VNLSEAGRLLDKYLGERPAHFVPTLGEFGCCQLDGVEYTDVYTAFRWEAIDRAKCKDITAEYLVPSILSLIDGIPSNMEGRLFFRPIKDQEFTHSSRGTCLNYSQRKNINGYNVVMFSLLVGAKL